MEPPLAGWLTFFFLLLILFFYSRRLIARPLVEDGGKSQISCMHDAQRGLPPPWSGRSSMKPALPDLPVLFILRSRLLVEVLSCRGAWRFCATQHLSSFIFFSFVFCIFTVRRVRCGVRRGAVMDTNGVGEAIVQAYWWR